MYRWLAMLIALALIAVSPGAMAAKKKKKKGGQPKIEMTGFESIDPFFSKVDALNARIVSANKNLNNGRKNLAEAIGVPKSTPIVESLEVLREMGGGKLSVQTVSGVPKIASSGAPEKAQAGIAAANDLVSDLQKTIADLKGVPKDAQALIVQAQKMPGKVKQEFQSGGLPMTQLPGKMKVVATNVKITTSMPKRAQELVQNMNGIVKTVATIDDPPKKASSGKKKKKKKKKGKGKKKK